MVYVERVPVVHSAAFEMFVSDRETERMDQVKTALGNSAEPTDVASVLRDLRIE